VKVIVAVSPEQIVVVPEIAAVGKACTVIVTEPNSVALQFGVPLEATPTNV
jgi:hypothetical protein